MRSKIIYAFILSIALMLANYAVANENIHPDGTGAVCNFQVVLEQTGDIVNDLIFDQAAIATETAPGSGNYHVDFIENGFPVYEQEPGMYTVNILHPSPFAGGAWVSLFENNPGVCVGALEINAESCAFQTVVASAGDCTHTGNKVSSASGAKGDSVTGSASFTAGVKDQTKAVAVHTFLTGDLKISKRAAATLCTGDCPEGQACFPDALEDVPADGCTLEVVNAGGGKSTYKLSWVGNGVRSCDIRALSCGCYTTK